MTGPGSQNEPAPSAPALPTLMGEMNDTLVAFSAYVRFERVAPEENCRRYYDLTWRPTLFGEGALVRTWGRLGRPGTSRTSFYPDRRCADTEARRVMRRRLAHGYRVVDWQ